jgi:hypothetical protein
MKYVVKYKVTGFGGADQREVDQTTEPYDTWELASEHQRDIAGFEGVYDCRIVSVEA